MVAGTASSSADAAALSFLPFSPEEAFFLLNFLLVVEVFLAPVVEELAEDDEPGGGAAAAAIAAVGGAIGVQTKVPGGAPPATAAEGSDPGGGTKLMTA